MRLLRSHIVDLLRENGDTPTAHQADVNLPREVDTDLDGDLLASCGIDVGYLLERFPPVGSPDTRRPAG